MRGTHGPGLVHVYVEDSRTCAVANDSALLGAVRDEGAIGILTALWTNMLKYK